jgi:hypothetical protein
MVSAMAADWYDRQQQIEELDRSIAENRRELAERRERALIEEAMPPPPAVDFSQCKSVGTMTQPQFSAWVDAGRPELPAHRAARQAADARRVAKAAAAVPATMPAPASTETVDWHALGEAIGEEIAHAVAALRTEMQAEIAGLRAEIKVRSEVEQLRHEIEALRVERRGLKVVSS